MAEQSISSSSPQSQQLQLQSIQEHLVYKNRLQEFTQRAKIPFPTYYTINEGTPHVPKFRSTVVVDGKTFTTSITFSNKKTAEQNVARIAFEGICERIKNCITCKTNDEAFPPIYEDRIFCKSILHEFALKMNIEKPVYHTTRQEGAISVFVSSLDFNGVTYTGEPSVTKKEAEQLAARAVILSILGNVGANVGTVMAEIIKSKAELFSALYKSNSKDVDKGGPSKASNLGDGNVVGTSIEGVLGDTTDRLIDNSAQEAFQGQSAYIEAQSAPSREISTPSTMPLSNQVESTLHRLPRNGKRRSKKKKKVNKKVKPEERNHRDMRSTSIEKKGNLSFQCMRTLPRTGERGCIWFKYAPTTSCLS